MMALVMSGCGKAKEQAAEAVLEHAMSDGDTKVDVDLSNGEEQVSLSAKTDDGTVQVSVGPSTEVPKGWPADVAIYTGMTVNVSNVMVEQNNYMIQGSVAAPVAKVKEFYTADMEKQGWKVETSVSQGGTMESIVATKDARQLTVMIVGEGESTTISLNVANKEG